MHRLSSNFVRDSISLFAGVAFSASLLAHPAIAEAAPADAAATDARELYAQGRAAFDAGKFAEAAEHFDAAYAQAQNPNLRYKRRGRL